MSYISSSSIRLKFSYLINFWNINESCPIKHYWSNLKSIFHPKLYKTNQWILLGLRFLDIIRYLEKKLFGFGSVSFGYGWFQLHNSNTYKIYIFFVCNGYGSVQIFRTQIKLDKHKYTRNTKNIQNLNKYLKIRKYSKDLKLYLKSDPRNQKIPKI